MTAQVDTLCSLVDVQGGPKPIIPDISVVIPTLGRPILENCLTSILLANEWPARIVVVDQSSNPGIAEMLRRAQAFGASTHYLPSKQRGRALGLNLGVEHVDTRYFAITDDDCLVSLRWLKVMRSGLEEHSGAIVTGRVEPGGEEAPVAIQPSTVPGSQVRPHLLHDNLVGGNMGTSKDVFWHVGPFDEDPRVCSAEDTEWAYRALRRHVPIFYVPEAWVTHYSWRDADRREEQYRAYALSHGGFYGKYLRRGDWFIAIRSAIHLARALRRWVRGARSGDLDARLHGRAYATRLIPGIVRGLRGAWREGPS